MDSNVNMVKPENVYIKESAKYIQNMGNVDLDKDAILVMIYKENVREKKNMFHQTIHIHCQIRNTQNKQTH